MWYMHDLGYIFIVHKGNVNKAEAVIWFLPLDSSMYFGVLLSMEFTYSHKPLGDDSARKEAIISFLFHGGCLKHAINFPKTLIVS